MKIMDDLGVLYLGARRLPLKRPLQPPPPVLVYARCSHIGDRHLHSDSQFGELTQPHPPSCQVDRCDVGHRVDSRPSHKEATTGTATHSSNLVVLEYADRFSQQCPAYTLPLDQLRFGSNELSRFHTIPDHRLGDVARNRFGTLAIVGLT